MTDFLEGAIAGADGLQPSKPVIQSVDDSTVAGGSAIVTFDPPEYLGKSGNITTYSITTTPATNTTTKASSPITITGLASATAYTINITATTDYGVISRIGTASFTTKAFYTLFGSWGNPNATWSMTVPAGKTKMMLMFQGAGGRGGGYNNGINAGGGGGGGGGGIIAYDIGVSPGTTYTINYGNVNSSFNINNGSTYIQQGVGAPFVLAGGGGYAGNTGGSGGNYFSNVGTAVGYVSATGGNPNGGGGSGATGITVTLDGLTFGLGGTGSGGSASGGSGGTGTTVTGTGFVNGNTGGSGGVDAYRIYNKRNGYAYYAPNSGQGGGTGSGGGGGGAGGYGYTAGNGGTGGYPNAAAVYFK